MSDMTVVELSGQAWVRDENGNLRELERGDVIASDETVVTADNASLVLAPASGEPMQVPPGAELSPESLMPADDDARPEESVDEASSEDSRDGDASPSSADQNPQNNLPQGPEDGPGDAHSSAPTIHEGQSFVRVNRIEEPVDPLEYQYGLEMGDWLETRRGGAQDDAEQDEDSGTSSQTRDEPPSARVELVGAGDDGIYSQDEIGGDGSVTARVTLNSNTEPGDQLVVTDGHGNVLLDRPVTQDDLDNGVPVEVPVEPGDTEVGVHASVTDEAGRGGGDTDRKPIEDTEGGGGDDGDETTPSVSVELTGSGDDGTYNQDEIGDDGSVTAQITLEEGTEVGDTLVVTDKDGNVLDEREVTQDDLDNGVSVEVPVEPGDPDVSVNAKVTDPTGNSDSDDDQKPIDNVPPAVSVELTGSGEDGTYSQDEIGDDGSVTAEVTLEDGTEIGDTLTVTDKDGNVLDEREVTQDDLDNGVSVEVPVEPGDPDVSVNAKVTDPTGNSSTDDDQKPIDNVPPAVSVELTGSGEDGTYSQDEIGDDGSVTAEVTLEDGTEVGDTLTVTDKDGNVLDEREVTQDDLDNGVSVEVPVEPGDPDVSVNAKVTDPTGNSDSDDDQKPIDWDVAVEVPNDHDSTTPDGEIGDQVVFESGLADGSNPNAADTRVESSFTLTALDGLQETGAVTLDYTDENGESATLSLSKAEVEALGDSNQTLTTQYGELTFNGYSQADDGTITLDYDYLLTKAPEEDVDNLMDSFTVTATDEDGSTDNGDLNIKIVDDAPTAEDDANSVIEGDDTASTVETSGNVIGGDGISDGDVADTEGADGATVTAVESVNTPDSEATDTGGTLVIEGEYGTLTLEADGSYSYVLDNTNLEVQGLSDGDTLTEAFTYTLTDGDTDSDDATLTITIDGSDDGVIVDVPNDHDSTTPDGEIGDQVVFESGLTDGSNPNAADTRVESSFTLTALDGLQDTGAVTLDYTDENGDPTTLSLSKAEVEALGDTPQSLSTQYGELTLNGYSQADDGTITLDYDYLLTQAPEEDVDNLMDSVTVTATDEDGSTDSGDLNIKIVDDAPTAEDDANSVTEGDDTASTVETSGNVIGGDTASAGDVADTEGADGATVTAVESVNTPDSEATDTGGTLVIEGEYGTLTLEADGSYTYQLDNSNLNVQGLSEGDTLTEAFTYTLTDGDTDADDATLTITIDGSDDGVTVDVPNDHDSTTPDGEIGDQVVFESGLADGSNPNPADTRVESSFTLTALDGLQETGAVTLDYTDENGDPAILELSKAEVEALGDTSQTLTTEYGELTLNGYSQADDGTITLDYDYVLTKAPEEDVDNLMDSVTVTATDRDGQSDSGDLNIQIVDDAPTAEDDTNSVTEDSATTTTGNVLGDSGVSDGDVADTEGADGATVTAVESTNVPGNSASGTDTLVIDGEYGTLTLEADGSYTYALDNTNLDVQGLSDGETLEEAFSYTLTDGDTDADDATLTITIDGSDDGVTVNVPNDHDSTTPDGEIGDQVVFESGLTDGSNPNAADTRVESSFTLTALDGLQETGAVTLDYTDENGESATLSLSKAEVEALRDTPQSLSTQYGELTLNGYSQADDGTITLDYDYVLTNAPDANVDDLMDSVTVTATDEDGSTDSGDLNIKIVDDAPTAEDDANSVTEGDDTASTVETSGNVIGGDTASAGDVADTEGADGATVTAVESVNTPDSEATDTGGTLVIEGEYGTLTIEADGSYSYALDNTNLDVQGLGDDDTLTEAFTYTLTDGDTDSDDATLTITIDGSDDGVTVNVPNEHGSTEPDGNINDQVVFESGLADGSNPNPADTRVESSFTLTALDGLQETGAVTLDYTDENGDPATLELSRDEVEALGDTSQTLTTEYGELTLDGYSQSADGTITLDYDYLLTNAPEEDVDNLMDSVTVTATDRDGQSDSGDLNIKIVDDAPVAEDDANSVTEDTATTTTGNVLGDSGASDGDVEDTEGADGATVTAVESVNMPDSDATETDGTLVIEGEYGTLTLEADGSYSYVLDNTNLEVQGLSDGDTLEEAFTYTLTDGDTDSDDATLTITIDGSDDGVTVDVPNDHDSTTPDGEIGDQVVFESGLTDGSNPNAVDTRVESSFTLTALDGLQDTGAVSLAYTGEDGEPATLELSKAEVEALGDTPQSLSTQYGELTLNGYSQADDGTITLDYDYILTNAPDADVDDLMDSVTVTATDEDGSTDSGDLNIKIVDDAPTAEDDANSVTEGDDTASTVETSGNVIGGDTASAGDVADTEGADGATVTAVESVNTPDSEATDTGGTLVIEGEYGTLTLEADGSYTYQLDNSNLNVQGLSDGETLTEAFTYTLTDGDTDADDATLTITIDGSDDGVTVDVPNEHDSTTPDGEIGDQVVFESGLADGSNPNAADTRVASSFTLKALDGLQETGAVTLDYTDENGDPATLALSKAEVEALGDTPQSLSTQHGELTLTGYSQADDGTITLDYDYLLTKAPGEDVEDLLDSVTVTATDRDGQSDSGDLNIQIVDDAPVAEDDANSVTEDTATTTTGNVLGDSGASDGDVEDTEGADGATVTAVESINVSGNSASGTDTLVIEGEYGTLTLETDGSYSYALDNTHLEVQGLSEGETLTEAFTYTLTDGDTDQDDATLTITIDGSDDGVTVNVPNEHDSTTPDGEIGDQVVFESGLTDGSNPNAADTRVESSFTLTALDGLQDTGAVSLAYTGEDGEPATLELSKAEVEALGDTPQSLSTQYGELTLNGYSQADDGTITLDYDYVLTNAPDADVDDLMDSVTVTATDEDGSTDSGDLNIKIVDDAPTAEDDANSVTEGADTSGNVIGGDGVSDGDVADIEGADGATVTAAESVNVSGNSASGTDPLVIVGEYGTLTLNADGSYTYEADPDSANADVQDVFTYTLQDGDGDESTATLTIDVTDVTGSPTDTTGSVDEAGLADGTEPSADSEIITGADLDLQPGWTVESEQSDTTSLGTWTVNTDGTFDYTLTDDTDHSGTSPTDSFEYTAVDEHGNTVTNTVTITIVDDQPVISVDNGQLGSVEVDETDFSGGEVSATNPGFIDGVFTIDHGADGEASTTYSLQVSDGDAAGVTDTASGEAVHLFMDGEDVVGRVGNDPGGEIAFRIALDGDSGAVTLTQTRPLEHPLGDAAHDDAIALSNGALQVIATAVDGDEDSVDSEAVDVGGQFTFRDDGPEIDGPPAAESIEEAALPNGSDPDAESTSVTAGLPVDFGEDGSGELAFSDDQTALEDYLSENGNGDVDIAVNGDTLTATRGGEPVFTVTLDTQSGNYTFELQGALVHPEEDQDLALNFAYQAVDADGDTKDGSFDVNVVDDAPTDIAITTPEDTPADPFTTSADATLDNVTIKDSDGNEVTGTDNGDGTRSFDVGFGTATVDDQGRVTFDPAPDYSNDGSFDVFSVVVDEDTGTPTETQVTVDVTPVADAPDLAGGSVETPEDTPVDLGLTAPSPVDTTDQNGATTGDNPELLGPISLGGIPEGTELLDGSGNVLWTSDGSNGGSLTIALTDGSHIASAESDADLTMTTAEYEALQIKPIAQSHENFTIDLSVTSYEVDAADHPLGGVDGAESTSQVDVGVQAVTDDVDLTIDGSDDPYTATIDEDSSLDLGNLLGASFEDLDGSEERSLEIGGVPEGTSITVNGNTITAGGDGTIVIPASDLGDFGAGTSTEIPASLALTPPADFSGDLDGITVTLKAQDHDSDAGDPDGTVKDDSVTLNIDTAPVADRPADIGAEGPEDTDIAFLADLTVSDTDGSESITAIGIDTVPDGWVIKDADGNVVHTGDDTSGFTIPEGDVTDGSYTGYTVTPPAHSSVDESLSLQVEVTDTSPYGPDTQTHDVTADIAVTPDAEEVGGDSDGDGDPDLTMNPDHTYGTDVDGTEDAWFALNADGFNPADGWANQDDDGSEETFALLTPELVGSESDVLNESAEGSSFRYSTDGGTTWVEETFNGSPIEVPVEYLDTLEFRAAPNQKGEFQIRVEARTVDTDAEGNTDTAVSGEAILDGIHIDEPVADLASLNVSSPAEGNEDEAISLDIRPQSDDPNETFRVTISDVPNGAVLMYDGNEVTDDDDGNYVIDDFDRNAPLTVTPPEDSNEDFTLTASVVTVDEYGGVTDTLDTPVTKPIEVPVNGVADEPEVTTDTPVYVEEDLDADTASVTLSDIITATSGEATGDGSETLTYRITGLDDQFDIEGATLIRGTGDSREWVATNPEAVTITTPENFSGQVDFSVTPIVTENDGDTREAAEQEVSFQVTPSPEATFNISSDLLEDERGPLSLDLVHENGDTNESLAEVWISEASVTGNDFDLYYGEDGNTTLADAAADGSNLDVVLDNGQYKLTNGAWNDIFAEGGAHVAGDAGLLEVQYAVTDTPNAGYEGAVDDVTSAMQDATHTVHIEAVTDVPTVTITDIENVEGSGSDADIDEPAKDVTADGNDSVAVTVDITQPDTDGSESLKYLLIDNVPAGVSVEGGEFVGQVAGGTGSQWRIDIDPDVAFDGTDTLSQTIEFTMGDGQQVDAIENQEITITGVTQDNGDTSQEESGSDSWTLTGEGDFGDGEDPSEIIDWNDANATMTEDTGMALSDLVTAEIGDTSDGRSAVTISNLPPGAVVNGMQQTTIDGETVWYASTDDSSNQGLQDLLGGITVTPPADWNDTDGPFSFDTTLTTQSPSGEENSETISLTPEVTPVTDTPTVEVSGGDAADGEDVDFTIDVASPADNPDVSLVDGQLVVSLDESGMTGGDGEPGSLWYNGEEITPDGDANYVIDGVAVGDSVNVSYRPGTGTWGSVSLTAEAATQENGAANDETSTGSSSSEIAPPPPEVTAGDATGSEDEEVVLQDPGVTLPDDSQSLDALLLENVPDGWLVKTGSDAGSATLAENVGSGSWSILENGEMPDYVGLVPPRDWSGTLDDEDALTLTARTTQDGESTNTSTDFAVDVQAVADGITMSPELSFGEEGDKIPLNLSASMSDTDGSETATIELTGLGEHAGFFTEGGNTLLDSLPDASVSYDSGSDTYTLSGIAPDQINDLYLVQGATDGDQSIGYEAWTTDGSDTSDTVSGDFNVNIEAVEPTSGDDTLLYTGEPLDGLDGVDVVEMRFGEDPNPDDLDNVETLDFMGEDQDHSVALEAQEVLDMTDDGNELSILGDSGDSVSLTSGEWSGPTDSGGYQVYQATESDATLKVQDGVQVEI